MPRTPKLWRVHGSDVAAFACHTQPDAPKWHKDFGYVDLLPFAYDEKDGEDSRIKAINRIRNHTRNKNLSKRQHGFLEMEDFVTVIQWANCCSLEEVRMKLLPSFRREGEWSAKPSTILRRFNQLDEISMVEVAQVCNAIAEGEFREALDAAMLRTHQYAQNYGSREVRKFNVVRHLDQVD